MSGVSIQDITLLPPDKQTAVALHEAVRATDLALPQAPKPQVVQPFSLRDPPQGEAPSDGAI